MNKLLWSNEEKELLKLHYPELGKCAELHALFPNRTLTAITVKATKLGLRVINNKRKRLTESEYLSRISSTNFIPLESYKSSTTPILHRCKVCSYEWLARPNGVLRKGAKCPECSLISRFNTVEEVYKTLNTAGIIRHSEYLGALKPIELEHIDCGYKWTSTYSNIQQGSGCPICNKANTYWANTDTAVSLYLLKIVTIDEQFLKIGVTNQNIGNRISKLKSLIKNNAILDLLHISEHEKSTALLLEYKILSENIKYVSKLKFDGYTELLSINNNIDLIKQTMDTDEHKV